MAAISGGQVSLSSACHPPDQGGLGWYRYTDKSGPSGGGCPKRDMGE